MSGFADMKVLDEQTAVARLRAVERPWAAEYFAMYSTWLGGIVTQPWLMSAPLDDHLVHRGDGVFEACKCVAGRVYQFDRHLDRLANSAHSIHLDLPHTPGEFKALCAAVARAGGRADCMIRIYVSRGPGGFTTNPFECPRPGVYVMVSSLHAPAAQAYELGVNMGVSRVPAKSGFYAAVKSCNYLPNVLLKREAVSRGWSFAVGVDDNDHLTEGATENFGLVDQNGRLCLPEPDNILEGTTARRCVELAGRLVEEGLLKEVVRGPLTVEDLVAAKEAMFFGTTLDVLPASRLDGQAIGDGKVGPVARRLLALIRDDIKHNPDASTPIGL
ncbi:aminotransferase class IV [Desulfarculus baarsii DSM 2075]|uniref:Aminotransferase class IV n=1 Tax=Desulfarculus baarsii (strain ATCC 33931 / DSM 2075 / LMG 7858 / VKM B-1802 / 2st14) TaxID=644282 RepID=E1QLN6_DESB2|nr:aminotransferase class IV [Desulfarculus baarsii]ADK86471.1 aminotransferase class IV [Desulfarculus baarsii DSM 2075]